MSRGCREYVGELVAFADGSLTSSRKEIVGRHVATCQECASVVHDYREIGTTVAQSTDATPPPSLNERLVGIAQGAHDQQLWFASGPAGGLPSRRKRVRRNLIFASAACLAVLAGLVIMAWNTMPDMDTVDDAPERAMRVLLASWELDGTPQSGSPANPKNIPVGVSVDELADNHIDPDKSFECQVTFTCLHEIHYQPLVRLCTDSTVDPYSLQAIYGTGPDRVVIVETRGRLNDDQQNLADELHSSEGISQMYWQSGLMVYSVASANPDFVVAAREQLPEPHPEPTMLERLNIGMAHLFRRDR